MYSASSIISPVTRFSFVRSSRILVTSLSFYCFSMVRIMPFLITSFIRIYSVILTYRHSLIYYNIVDRLKPILFFFSSFSFLFLSNIYPFPLSLFFSLSPLFIPPFPFSLSSFSYGRISSNLCLLSIHFLCSLRSLRFDRTLFFKSIKLYFDPYSNPLMHDQRSTYFLFSRSSTNLRFSSSSSSSLPSFLTLFRILSIPAPVAFLLSLLLSFLSSVPFSPSHSRLQPTSSALSFAPPFPVLIRRSRAAGGTEKRRP